MYLHRLPPTETRSAPDETDVAGAPAIATWPNAECAAPGRRAEFETNRKSPTHTTKGDGLKPNRKITHAH